LFLPGKAPVKIRSLAGLTVLACPFCDRRIVGDPESCSFFHEYPKCAEFGPKLLARFPSFRAMKVEPTIFVEEQGKKGP
jgi:hypothetical protein